MDYVGFAFPQFLTLPGYCVFNDVACAAARLHSQGFRVLCLDLDVHQVRGMARLRV
jgi:acetoin utilization deacetylase AcuC-like enzyme